MKIWHKLRLGFIAIFIIGLVLPLNNLHAATIRLAVASNFLTTARVLVERFEHNTKHKVLISFGSSGQLLSQIINGAPFDLFLAADESYIAKAEAAGVTIADTRFVYAVGQLALYSRTKGLNVRHKLITKDFENLAVANPQTAPYGRAAYESLKSLKLSLNDLNLVQGISVAQAYHFVESANAELGFIALSHIIHHNEGSRWLVPQTHYQSINQEAVVLDSNGDQEAIRNFQSFLQSDTARAIIETHGYLSRT